MNVNNREKYDTIRKKCRLLYENPCPWECGRGWDNLLSEFSYKCEELNLRFHRKYHMRIELDQIKQKYGDLVIYSNIRVEGNIFERMLEKICEGIGKLLNKIDFKLKLEVNRGYSTMTISTKHTDSENHEDEKHTTFSNIAYSKIGNVNVDYKISNFLGEHKYVPSRFIPLHNLKRWFEKTCDRFFTRSRKLTRRQEIIFNYMHIMLERYVKEAEGEAEKTCEECGTYMDGKYVIPCSTYGWVSVICESCAKKSKRKYKMNGKTYCEGVEV